MGKKQLPLCNYLGYGVLGYVYLIMPNIVAYSIRFL